MGAFRSRRQWLESSISTVLYVAFAIITQLAAPERIRLATQLRFEFVLPLLFIFTYVLRSRLPLWFRETTLLIVSVAAGSLEIFPRLHHPDSGEYTAHVAVLVVLIFVNTVMRVRPSFAVAAFAWAISVECVLIGLEPQSSRAFEMYRVALILGAGFLTVISNYGQDREARLAFLKFAQKDRLAGDLAQSNQRLAQAASTDGLTGLANRSSFDAHLTDLWSRPELSTEECSIVMADIDDFKGLNDRYGHLYGDRVLKRVARLMAEALRGEDDFIARYGGEEFVVVLPNTSMQLALRVAERLRGLVELAGLPAVRTGDPDLHGLRATISCGVSAGIPALIPEASALLGAADAALYRAKRDGRNLVREWRAFSPNTASEELV
ncbi:diguanylate cyclase (GGDEF) domain-containing protein [Terriglobus roseus]|uniref:diguanylate cyclase n=1 Tax=Terriglobus roseus TaxID=392734 RepID=A0A1H4K094_9BACT|nr:diguanylate cyclase (GGDEF) domain-containing protein [Terriglobus roseus]